MQVLFVTSEVYPLIKTGGLADVSGALPKALKGLTSFDGDVKILLPGYNVVLNQLEAPRKIATMTVLDQHCELLLATMPNPESQLSHDTAMDILVVKAPALYERDGGPYVDEKGDDWPDNAMRFAVLSRVASLLCCEATPYPAWKPTLVHCNDWQTGLVPAYLKLVDHSPVKSIFSIHNLAYQGTFDANCLTDLALPIEHFKMEGFEYYDQLSFLKAGLYYADKLTTVSPTYAQEIQTPAFGFGMEGLLQSRSEDLIGILNGIDTQVWNPETDGHLAKKYSNKRITGKKTVKRALQTQLGLTKSKDTPLLGVVSRFAHQKGLDLLPNIMPKLIALGCQFSILGSGDKAIESQFLTLAQRFSDKISVTVDYNEVLSHSIMAGSDLFIMPSRFEPCGLNQMYGLAYGTPPVVSATGGLADSVIDTNEDTLKDKTATGFVMSDVSEEALLACIMKAISYWHKPVWRSIQRHGMQLNLSWESRAQVYLLLYQEVLVN